MTQQTSATLAAAYLAENAAYVDEMSAVALSGISDADWPAILAALDVVSGGATDPGIDCAVTVTAETLADFEESRARSWSEPGRRTEHQVGGRRAVHYERFQLHRGEPRKDMVVVDLGERRVALY